MAAEPAKRWRAVESTTSQGGGGFARYSVDAKWVVPHFEKMLYDNAQLLGVYARLYAATGMPPARRSV